MRSGRMPCRLFRRSLIPLLGSVAVMVLPAAPAPAATPRVPKPITEFFGVMADGPLITGQVDVAREAALMRRAGVGNARMALYWRDVEPAPGDLRWEPVDRLVGAFANAGVRVMPVIVRA